MQSFLTDLRHVNDKHIVFNRSTVQFTLANSMSRVFLDKLIVFFFLSNQVTSYILWEPKAHDRIHNSPPIIHILIHIKASHAIFFYFFKIHVYIIQRLRIVLPSCLFPPVSLHASLHPLCPTGLANLILCRLITQEIHAFFCRAKKIHKIFIKDFPRFLSHFLRLDTNFFLSSLFWQLLGLCSFHV